MGGNIFKTEHEVVRLELNEYNEYVKEISLLLYKLGIIEFFPTQGIRNKTDFGDMDIILPTRPINSDVFHYLSTQYPNSRNGDVFSFLYKKFQIDLIQVDPSVYKYACHYFSWNDLGNLVGRIAKQLGFKHGHDGLYYIQRDGDLVLKTHLLSTCYLDILNILGLYKYKFMKGFDTYTQLFDYVMSSPYYNPDIFKLENLNNINRVRDRKRKTYNMFLQYALEREHLYESKPKLSKEERADFVFNLFPIKDEVDRLYKEHALKKEVASKTNGNLLMSFIPELSGKELGVFISYLKENAVQLYREDVLTMSEDEIKEVVLTAYKAYTNVSI